VELVGAASSLFARAVRRGLIAETCASSSTDLPEAPGVVELDASGDPARMSSARGVSPCSSSVLTPHLSLRYCSRPTG
ncbi:MAG: hypothetical protein ACRDL8_13225, partial [Solirubrobacteraceae bacterium]